MGEDTRALLERAVGWYEPRGDPEEARRRAERRRQPRRLAVVLLAALLVVGSGGLLAAAFLGGPPAERPADDPDLAREEMLEVAARVARLQVELETLQDRMTGLTDAAVDLDRRIRRLERILATTQFGTQEARLRLEVRLLSLRSALLETRSTIEYLQGRMAFVLADLEATTQRLAALRDRLRARAPG